MSQAGQLEVVALKAAIGPLFFFFVCVCVCTCLCLLQVYVWVSVYLKTRG